MSTVKLKIQKLSPEVQLPKRANATDSGFDLYLNDFKKAFIGNKVFVPQEEFEKDLKKKKPHPKELDKAWFPVSEVEPTTMPFNNEIHSVDNFVLGPGERVVVGTGIKATVGPGYEIQIRPRSGNAINRGLTVVNTPGTVDEQYRGELMVGLVNLSGNRVVLRKGERIAQLVVAPVILAELEEVPSLDDTARGAGGFGSTGLT